MVDANLVEELAVASSACWATLIKRHEVIGEYLQLPRPIATDVREFAGKIGLSQRSFYRLIKEHRHRRAGNSRPTKITGRGTPISNSQEAAIAEAIRLSGPGAATKKVVEAARIISADIGIPTPSEPAIIARLRRGGDLAGLNEKLKNTAGWIVDACLTDIEIELGGGQTQVAWIVGLVDLTSGKIQSHRLCIAPNAASVASVIGEKWYNMTALTAECATLAVTPVIGKYLSRAIYLSADGPVAITPCCQNGIRSGEALRCILGLKLGAIQLRTRLCARAEKNRATGVPKDIACAVVTKLIEEWNEKATS